MGKKLSAVAKGRARAAAREAAANAVAGGPRPSDGPIVPLDGNRTQCGLTNLGNTCYMNCILQTLNVSLPFSDMLMTLAKEEGLAGLSGSLCGVFYGIRGAEVSAPGGAKKFDPKFFHTQLVEQFPWYAGRQQQDAHEFLRMLLGAVGDAATDVEAVGADAIKCGRCVAQSFRGQICSMTLCWGCGLVSARQDEFLDLSLDVPTVHAAELLEVGGELGVTPLLSQPPLELEVELDDEEDEEEGGMRRPAAPKAMPAPKAAPMSLRGAWGDKERLEASRVLVLRIVVKVLAQQEREVAGRLAPSTPIQLRAELVRAPKKKWGFRWNRSLRKEGVLVIGRIIEDSVLDKFNLKQLTLGQKSRMLSPGDRLVEVSGQTSKELMEARLIEDDTVQLCFLRDATIKVDLSGPEDSEGEAERELARAAAEEARKNAFIEFRSTAARCCDCLPEPLRTIFGSGIDLHQPGALQVTLTSCLQRLTAAETIEDDFLPSYRCSNCPDGKSYASRRTWFLPFELPPILTVQLKRFRRAFEGFSKSKMSVAVAEQLDLSNHVMTLETLQGLAPHVTPAAGIAELLEKLQTSGGNTSCAYELFGICEHRGKTMERGHYVAYVNCGPSLEAEDWRRISDEKLSKVTRADVLKIEAYLAFYRRRQE